jgi:hypothetical protein
VSREIPPHRSRLVTIGTLALHEFALESWPVEAPAFRHLENAVPLAEMKAGDPPANSFLVKTQHGGDFFRCEVITAESIEGFQMNLLF